MFISKKEYQNILDRLAKLENGCISKPVYTSIYQGSFGSTEYIPISFTDLVYDFIRRHTYKGVTGGYWEPNNTPPPSPTYKG